MSNKPDSPPDASVITSLVKLGADITLDVGVPILTTVHAIMKSRGIYQQVIDWIGRRQTQHVIVLGCTGVGKSSFLKRIRGLNPQIRREDRTDDPERHKGEIDSCVFEFMDTPGQAMHKSKRVEAIRDGLGRKHLGIINVVAYGYHESTASRSEMLTGRTVQQGYLRRRQDEEIRQMAEWIPLLCGRGGPASWLITVVNKADLWWQADTEEEIRTHYEEGEYFNALGDAKELDRSTRFFSTLNQPFLDIVPMSGFYGDSRRAADYGSLIAKLLERAASGGVD